ncbi:MAG TPA: PPC domain-containing protein, partial [Aggregatilineales bacterium]|nr:PPC domain-containing protein [Aggregatilineales bacterium]
LNTTERLIPVIATQTILPTPTPFPAYIPSEAQPLVAGQRLESHIPIRATLSRPDGVYIYALNADAGTIITIGASPIDNTQVRLRLELVDPEGTIITRATVNGSVSNGDTVIPAFPVPISGVYQVFVTSENGILGDYILSYGVGATRLDRLMGNLAHDQTITNRIDKRGVRDVWVVELRRGDTITLSATPNDLVFDPVLELVPVARPNELTVIDDNSGGNRAPFVRTLMIAEDGLYLVRIYAQNAASLGGYSLVWRYIDRAATPTPPPPAIPLMTVRDMVAQDTYAFYPFQGYAGQKIEVQVIGETAGFDPVVALISPTGETLIEADDSGGTLNPTFTFTIPADGVYRLRVNGYLSSGAFVVFVRELF